MERMTARGYLKRQYLTEIGNTPKSDLGRNRVRCAERYIAVAVAAACSPGCQMRHFTHRVGQVSVKTGNAIDRDDRRRRLRTQSRSAPNPEEVPLNLRQLALAGLAALAVGGTAVAQTGPSTQVTPPPVPPANGNVATPGILLGTPSPSTSPAPGRRGRRGSSPSPSASPSDTPEPPQFSTMDGVWEIQLQPLNGSFKTTYSHLFVTQKGDDLTGTWIRENNDKVPFTGTFDGRLFKLTATDVKKNTWTLAGYAENFSDMVGLVIGATPGDKGTPFTASHRKKERLNEVGGGRGRPPSGPPH
jgi:hypothetical protein